MIITEMKIDSVSALPNGKAGIAISKIKHKPIIFRDDDLSYKTDLIQFKKIHEMFAGKKAKHTIAIICDKLIQNKPLIYYIKENIADFDIQIHCWQHYDFIKNTSRLSKDFTKCVKLLQQLFSITPTTVYPPWNKSDDNVIKIATSNGLTVSNQKCSLSYYVKNNGNVEQDVINFHHWADEITDLPKAIEIYESNSR